MFSNCSFVPSRVITYKVLFMPPRFESELPFKTYPRLRVEGEIADVPMRGAWMPVGDGRRYFIVLPQIKANTGLDVGDDVEMRFPGGRSGSCGCACGPTIGLAGG